MSAGTSRVKARLPYAGAKLQDDPLVVLATRDPRRPQVAARFEAWSHEGESLHAPELMPYEVANAVAGLLATGTRIDPEDLEEVWRAV